MTHHRAWGAPQGARPGGDLGSKGVSDLFHDWPACGLKEEAEKDRWRALLRETMEQSQPGLFETLSGQHRTMWRYLVPSRALGNVLILGDRVGMDFLATAPLVKRLVGLVQNPIHADWIRSLIASEGIQHCDVVSAASGEFPFREGQFDLVIAADYGRPWSWGGPLFPTLREIHRVLAIGGYLYLTVENRFRSPGVGVALPRLRRQIKGSGFDQARGFASYPKAAETKLLLDLRAGGVFRYLVSSYLDLDLRKRGMAEKVTPLLCGLKLTDYLVPGYAMVCKRGRA